MPKVKVYRDVVESVTWWAHKGKFFPHMWDCGYLWSHWLHAFPGRTEAFWDTEQNMWRVQNFKSIVPNKEFTKLNKLQLTYFSYLKIKIGKLSSIEVNDKTLTGTKVSPIKSNVTLWLQLWSLWPTSQDFVHFFPLKFLFKTSSLSCLISHHLQIYYQKNTIILAHNKSVNLKPRRWNATHTSQFILSHYIPARTLCLIFHTILITIKYVKQFYKCFRISWEIARLLVLYDSYVMLAITIKAYTELHNNTVLSKFSVCILHLYFMNTQSLKHTVWYVPLYYLFQLYCWSWKPFVCHRTPGAEFTVCTLQNTSRTVWKIMRYKRFVLGHLDCSFKKNI